MQTETTKGKVTLQQQYIDSLCQDFFIYKKHEKPLERQEDYLQLLDESITWNTREIPIPNDIEVFFEVLVYEEGEGVHPPQLHQIFAFYYPDRQVWMCKETHHEIDDDDVVAWKYPCWCPSLKQIEKANK